ncbi:sigma-54 interaction domain-containing protein [Magnetococcales bacterium HHB-1]
MEGDVEDVIIHECERGCQCCRQLMVLLENLDEKVIWLDALLTIQHISRMASEDPLLNTLFPGDNLGLQSKNRQGAGECLKRLTKKIKKTIRNQEKLVAQPLLCMDSRGEAQHRSVTTIPVRGPDGKIEAVLVTLKTLEATEAKEAQKSKGQRVGFHQFGNIIGDSPIMNEVYTLIDRFAPTDASVLLTGESGTGKELAAEALHDNSHRRQGPLVKVNCAALSESLLASELFGHVRGAFTGAVNNHQGRFAKADGGTIFLDEIGEIPPQMQTKLLRVLQQKEFEPVGSSKTMKVNVRLIAATNQNLRQRINEGHFREDLYYRLNVVEIRLPALRERSEDIPLLSHHLLEKLRGKYHKSVGKISPRAMEKLMAHSWQGNVRQLENVLEHAFVMSNKNVIRRKDLPATFTNKETIESTQPWENPESTSQNPPIPSIQEGPKETNERKRILEALEKTRWHKVNAAKLLGMSRSSLYRRIEKYQLE